MSEIKSVNIKEIKLSGERGGTAIVSSEDYDRLVGYTWFKTEKGYVAAKIEGKQVRMHRMIIQHAKEGELIDHINRIKHDNTRGNLRITTPSVNAQNRTVSSTKIGTAMRNVYYKKGKYQTEPKVNGQKLYQGLFKTEEEAADAADMFVVHNNRDLLQLNYPEKLEEYRNREFVEKKRRVKKAGSYVGVKKEQYGYAARITEDEKYKRIYSSPSYNWIFLTAVLPP